MPLSTGNGGDCGSIDSSMWPGPVVGVAVGIGVVVAVAVGSGVAVSVGMGVLVIVAVGTGVSVGTSVAVAVAVGVSVGLGVFVGVSVGCAVAVSVGTAVAVGSCEMGTPQARASARHPSTSSPFGFRNEKRRNFVVASTLITFQTKTSPV